MSLGYFGFFGLWVILGAALAQLVVVVFVVSLLVQGLGLLCGPGRVQRLTSRFPLAAARALTSLILAFVAVTAVGWVLLVWR